MLVEMLLGAGFTFVVFEMCFGAGFASMIFQMRFSALRGVVRFVAHFHGAKYSYALSGSCDVEICFGKQVDVLWEFQRRGGDSVCGSKCNRSGSSRSEFLEVVKSESGFINNSKCAIPK